MTEGAGAFLTISTTEDVHTLGNAGIGPPHFRAIDHPLISPQLCFGGDVTEVRSRAWLGEHNASQLALAGGQLGQPFFLLCIGAIICNGSHAQTVVGRNCQRWLR